MSFSDAEDMFPEQLAFYNELSRNAIACGSRRMGKSAVIARKMRKYASMGIEHNVYYITKSRDSGKRIMWLMLLSVCKKYKDDIIVNISELSIFFKKTNSFIWLRGANNSLDIERLRGVKLKYVCIDEAQLFSRVLYYIIEDVLEPSLIDLQGTIDLTGTPNAMSSGAFYQLCHDKYWSNHYWTIHNNTFLLSTARQANPKIRSGEDIVDEYCKRKNISKDDPKVQREYYGRWVKSEHLQVYKYNANFNHYEDLPQYKLEVVLGIDLGWYDDALVAVGFNKHLKQCYILKHYKVNKQDITGLCVHVEQFRSEFNPYLIVMDTGALGRKIADEITNRYKIPIIAAEKQRKAEFIELFNDHLRQNLIKIKKGSDISEEMELLCWNDDKFRDGVYEENKDTPNHCCDAALYAWRYIFNYLYEPEIDPFDMSNPSEKRMLYRMQEENKKQEYEEVEVVAEWNS